MGAIKGLVTVIIISLVVPMLYFGLQPTFDITTALCHAMGGNASLIADKNNAVMIYAYVAVFVLAIFGMILSGMGVEGASTYRRR